MTYEYADITSVSSDFSAVTETLFRQRDEAIAGALIHQQRVKERDADILKLSKHNYELRAENAKLRSRLIENGIDP